MKAVATRVKGRLTLPLAAVLLALTACGDAASSAGSAQPVVFVGGGQLFDETVCPEEQLAAAGQSCEDGDFRLSGVTMNGRVGGWLPDVDLDSADGVSAVLRPGLNTWVPDNRVDPDFSCAGETVAQSGLTFRGVPDEAEPAPAGRLEAGTYGSLELSPDLWVSVRPSCIEEIGRWTATGGSLDGRAGSYVYVWDSLQHRLELMPS